MSRQMIEANLGSRAARRRRLTAIRHNGTGGGRPRGPPPPAAASRLPAHPAGGAPGGGPPAAALAVTRLFAPYRWGSTDSSPGSRGPKMRRWDSSIRTSLMLASRLDISPSDANSHCSLP